MTEVPSDRFRYWPALVLLVVVGAGVAAWLLKPPTRDRRIAVNALTDQPGRDTECFRLTLDPKSDDMILEVRGDTLAMTGSTMLVRMGEADAAVWVEIPRNDLAVDWRGIVDGRAAIGDEMFGQTGRENNRATFWELEWLRLVCLLDTEVADPVLVTGSAIGLYAPDGFPYARGFQVERESGRWQPPSPVVAVDDLQPDQRAELQALAASLHLFTE